MVHGAYLCVPLPSTANCPPTTSTFAWLLVPLSLLTLLGHSLCFGCSPRLRMLGMIANHSHPGPILLQYSTSGTNHHHSPPEHPPKLYLPEPEHPRPPPLVRATFLCPSTLRLPIGACSAHPVLSGNARTRLWASFATLSRSSCSFFEIREPIVPPIIGLAGVTPPPLSISCG
jgi:hypothetical protein